MTYRSEASVVSAVAAAAAVAHVLAGALLPGPWLLPAELANADGARGVLADARDGSSTLWSVLISPAWTFTTATALAVTKVIGAASVALTALPAYALARRYASARGAAAAAAMSVVAPATLSAELVAPDAAAYPLVATASLLLVRFVERRDGHDAVGALLVLGLAAALRPATLMFLLAAVLLVAFGSIGAANVLRWPGAAALGAVPVILYVAYQLGRSVWQPLGIAGRQWPDTLVAAGGSVGALALGVGLVPVAAALGSYGRLRAMSTMRAPAAVLGVAVVALSVGGVALAAESSDAASAGDSLVVYALPLLLAVALGATVRPLHVQTLAAGAILTLLAASLVATDDVPDLRIPSLALSRAVDVQPPLLAVYAVGAVVAAAAATAMFLGSVRRARPYVFVVGAAASGAITLATSVLAFAEARRTAFDALERLPEPPSLVADRARGERVTIVARLDHDVSSLAGLLFWTPSARLAEPPIDARSVDAATGTIDPPLASSLLFALNDVALAGRTVVLSSLGRLIDANSGTRMAETVEGIYADGWSGAHVVYRRFGVDGPGELAITLSRRAWSGEETPDGVRISIGDLGGVARPVEEFSVGAGAEREVSLAVPARAFRVILELETFSPADVGETDDRQLGQQVSFVYRSRG